MVTKRNSAIESNNAFTAKVEDLVKEIVIQNNILYYRIESSVEHLAGVQGEDNFMPVIRVITYFEDTVRQISELLNAEFDIVEKSAVDRQQSKLDSFSYKHVQYIVGLKANRRDLIEYKRSGDKKFEIQICSMLQDAWAGIEKELGYDSASFPEEAKRDLYRVGALLEMADMEFLKIRSKLNPQTAAPQHTIVINEVNDTVPAAKTPQPRHEVIVNDVPEEPVKVIPVAVPEAIVPQRTMPVEAPAAITPKPAITEVPKGEPVVEQKPIVVEEKKQEPVAARPEPAPAIIQAEQQRTEIPEPVKASINVNTEKTAEAAIDPGSVPFFEDLLSDDQTRTTKPMSLDENAPITDGSLKEYVVKSKLLKEIDRQIADRAGARINDEIDIEGDVERLRFLKVYTLKQLHDRLKDNSNDIVTFAEKWIGKDNGGSFDSGISLFYLEYLLVGKKNDPAFAVEYVVKFISDNDYSARYIIPTYNSIRNTEAPNFSHLTLK